MAEEQAGNAGETPETADGTTPAASGTTGVTPTDVTALQAELDKAKAALKAANAESASRRKRLEELEKAEQDRQQAALSETEKLKAEVAEMTTKAQTAAAELQVWRIKVAVMAKAAELGFASPEDAYILTDVSAVEVGDDGKVTGFEKALEALSKSGRLPMKQAANAAPGTPPRNSRPAAGVAPQPQPAPVRINF